MQIDTDKDCSEPDGSADCQPWSVVRGPSPGFVGALLALCGSLRVACGWLWGRSEVALRWLPPGVRISDLSEAVAEVNYFSVRGVRDG